MQTVHLNSIDINLQTYGNRQHPLLILIHGLIGNHTGMAMLAEKMSDCFLWSVMIVVDMVAAVNQQHFLYWIMLMILWQSLILLVNRHIFLVTQWVHISRHRQPFFHPIKLLAVTKSHDDGSGSSIARILRQHNLHPEMVTEAEIEVLISVELWSPETSVEEQRKLNNAANERSHAAQIPILNAKERQAISDALVGFDLRQCLTQLQCPTLVLAGLHDGINSPQLEREVANLIPNARFLLFTHSGHMSRQEEPRKLEQCLRQFLG